MKAILLKAALVVALIGSAAVAEATLAPEAQQATSAASKGAKKPKSIVRVRGKVRNLYPGASARLRVKLRNRSATTVRVRRIKARVRKGAPGCGRHNLVVRKKKLRRKLPPHARKRARLRVRMIGDAADACQGARFKIRFRAKVRR